MDIFEKQKALRNYTQNSINKNFLTVESRYNFNLNNNSSKGSLNNPYSSILIKP